MGIDMYVFNFAFAVVLGYIMVAGFCHIKNKRPKIWYFVVAMLICYPWQMGNNVYSVFGGKNTRGSVYSLVSIYQDAQHDALSFLGFGGQNAGDDAGQLVGISLYQNAKNVAVQMLGISFYQNARDDAYQFAGISLYQNAGGDVGNVFGISFWQNAGDNVVQIIGISLYQKANNNTVVGFGIPVYQKAKNFAGISWKLSQETFKEKPTK